MSVRPLDRMFILSALLVVSAFATDTISYHLARTDKFAPAGGGREYFDYLTFDPGSLWCPKRGAVSSATAIRAR